MGRPEATGTGECMKRVTNVEGAVEVCRNRNK